MALPGCVPAHKAAWSCILGSPGQATGLPAGPPHGGQLRKKDKAERKANVGVLSHMVQQLPAVDHRRKSDRNRRQFATSQHVVANVLVSPQDSSRPSDALGVGVSLMHSEFAMSKLNGTQRPTPGTLG